MRIGRANQAYLEWVDAEPFFHFKSVLEGGPGVFILQHLVLFYRTQIKISLVPSLIVSEFIVR